jgi:hypothetical protein
MPKRPQGQKRPADMIGNAVHVMGIATAERLEARLWGIADIVKLIEEWVTNALAA